MSKNNIDIYDAIPSVGHLIEENIKLKKENQELKDKVKELEFLNENLNKYIDNFRQNANIQKLYDNQQIYKLKQENQELKEQVDYYKKEMESEQCFRENLQIDLIEFVGAIKILGEYVAISKVKNEETGKWDIPVMYSLGLSKKISKEQKELLERVFESVGEE